MLRPSSPADHDRAATHTGSCRMSSSAGASEPASLPPIDVSKSPIARLVDAPGHDGESPAFKHDKISENAKSAERRRSSFIWTHSSKHYGPFAPPIVVALATKAKALRIAKSSVVR